MTTTQGPQEAHSNSDTTKIHSRARCVGFHPKTPRTHCTLEWLRHAKVSEATVQFVQLDQEVCISTAVPDRKPAGLQGVRNKGGGASQMMLCYKWEREK